MMNCDKLCDEYCCEKCGPIVRLNRENELLKVQNLKADIYIMDLEIKNKKLIEVLEEAMRYIPHPDIYKEMFKVLQEVKGEQV